MKSKYISPKIEPIELVRRSSMLAQFSLSAEIDDIDWEGSDGDDYWTTDQE